MKFADDSAGILEPPVAARARALHCGAMSTRIRPSATLFSLLAVLCWSSSTHAGGLPVRTESSLARGILLPALGQSPDDSGWRWQIDLTNEFVLAQNGSESLVLDAETASLRLAETVQINADWFAGAELQLLRTGGGFMDSLIEDWHEFFGLPNAGRERRPQARTEEKPCVFAVSPDDGRWRYGGTGRRAAPRRRAQAGRTGRARSQP